MTDHVLPGPGSNDLESGAWRPTKFDDWVEQWLSENGQNLPFPPRTDAELEVLLERLRAEPSVSSELAERLVARLAVELNIGGAPGKRDRMPTPRLPDDLGRRVTQAVHHELKLESLLRVEESPEVPVGLSTRVLSGVRKKLDASLDGESANARLDLLLEAVPEPESPVGLTGRVLAGLNAERGILDAAERSRRGRVLPWRLVGLVTVTAAAALLAVNHFGAPGSLGENDPVKELTAAERETTLERVDTFWAEITSVDFALGQLDELDVWLIQHSEAPAR